MSGNSNVAHVASVDKGLKMKIKRTKVPNKVDPKHEVIKGGMGTQNTSSSSTSSSLSSLSSSSSVSPQSTSVGLSLSSSSHQTAATISSLSTTASPQISTSSSSAAFTSSVSTISFASNYNSVTSNPAMSLLKPTGGCSDALSNSVTGSGKSPSKIASNLSVPLIDGKSPKSKAAYGKKVKETKCKGDNSIGATHSSSICSVSGSSVTNMEGRILTSTSGLSGAGQAFSTAVSNSPLSVGSGGSGILASAMTSEPRPGDTVHMKKENPVHDPYEFNAKVEDKIELPPKKLKLDKVENMESATSPQPPHHLSSSSTTSSLPSSVTSQSAFQSPHRHHHQQQQQHYNNQQQQQQQQQQQVTVPPKHHVAVDACSVGLVTEPDCLGPCEPGTSVGLEGIVWKETDNGLLVVNVTWRGKTYVGTLMDATRYAWAPPRPSGCESPISDFESRTPKGRGKRTSRNSVQATEKLPEGRKLRKGRRGTASNFAAPASPAKSDSSSLKRKARGNDVDVSEKAKRSRSCSRGVLDAESPTTDGYIVCPEPNCHKKYKHMNGLRYHRTHAHRKSSVNDDVKDEEEEDEEEEEEKTDKKERVTTMSERSERMKAKEKQRLREQRSSNRDSKDSLDDDIPLKEIASKANSQAKDLAEETNNKDKEEETDESIKYNNNTYAVSVNNKTDPQVVLHKTAIPHGKDSSGSHIITNTGKKNEGSNPELSSSSSSSSPSSSYVPSIPQASENNVAAIVNNNASSNNNNMSVMTTLKSPITSQIYQISPTGSLGGVSLISHGISTLSMVTAQTLPLMSSTVGQTPPTLSTSTVTSPVAAPSVTSSDKQGNKINNIKGVMGTRPVASTLSSQMANINNPQISSVSSLSPSQTSPLKPIQPKPVMIGEYQDSAQARKNKKKKDTEGPGSTPGSAIVGASKSVVPGKDSNGAIINMAHDESAKNERSAVIKAPVTPSRALDGKDLPSMSHLEIPKSSNNPFPPSHESPKMPNVATSDPSALPGTRLAVPPNSLAIGPTMHNSMDHKSPATDDIHSPAYSDISDANDSNSPPQQDSPSKKDSSVKRDSTTNGPQHLGPDGAPLPQHFGNMYYFGGPPNYLPPMSSPTLTAKNPGNKKEGFEDNRPSSSNEEGDKKDVSRPLNPQDVDIHQKNLINYINHMHGFVPPDLPYRYNIPGFGQPSLDTYMAQMLQQQDPIHRQHLAEQQKRLLQQQQDNMSGKSDDNFSKGLPFPGPGPVRPVLDSNGKPIVMSGPGIFNSSDGVLESKKMGDDLSQNLRERPSEGNPFAKETLDMKSQGESHHDMQHQSQAQQTYQFIKQQQQHQQQQNIFRAQMLQQQQHKQKMYETQRQDKRKVPEISNPSLLPQNHGAQNLAGRRIDGMKQGDLISHDMIKKELHSGKDIVRPDSKVGSLDNKRFEIKEEVRCPSRPSSSSMDSNKGRPPSQSNQSSIPSGNIQGSLSQSASSSSAVPLPSASLSSASSSSSTPIPSSLAGTIPPTPMSGAGPFPYSSFYPPHFRPVQMDPNHPMYRSLNPHIIGFAGAPPGTYIHPSQIGYRLPTVEGDIKSGIPDGVESLKINPDAGPVHKIHELQEKGRPSPGVHSPVPPSKTAGDGGRPSSRPSSPGPNSSKDKQRDYANSPPTQRHVHTHHHTHVVGGFPPLYAPEAYSAIFSHPAAAAAAAAASIQPPSHPFPPASSPAAGPKT